MMKSAIRALIGLLLVMNSTAFARSHHKHDSSAVAHSGPVYGTWKAPYELPPGLGPNDIPFAPF
jgi:hypothetical protein